MLSRLFFFSLWLLNQPITPQHSEVLFTAQQMADYIFLGDGIANSPFQFFLDEDEGCPEDYNINFFEVEVLQTSP